jgi:hypothetical protein
LRKHPVRWITRTGLLLAVALAVQSLRIQPPFGQVITGGSINAILFLAVILVDTWAGVAIGLITPWVALMMNITGLPFMVPFIMAANAILALSFGLLQRFSRFFAGVIAAVAKYGWFLLTVNVLLGLIGRTLPPAAVVTFGITQLATALIGVMLAFIIADTITPYLDRRQG